MNTAEIIYEKSKALPESFALEVLDFIGYLELKTLKASPFKITNIELGFGCAGYADADAGEVKLLRNEHEIKWTTVCGRSASFA